MTDAKETTSPNADLEFSRSPTIICPEEYTTDKEKVPVSEKDLEAAVSALNSPTKPLSSLRKSLILTVLSGALFFDVFVACAVITALPTLGKDLNFSSSSLQWTISAYTLTFGSFMLISGRLSDIFSPKPVFVLGFLIVGLMAIPIAAGVNPIMVIVFRALQGIGAAMNTPTAVSMVSTTFGDNEKERSRAFAIFGALGAVGNVSGFVIGGVLTARLSWRWVFYILAIVVIPFAIASWFVIPSQPSKQQNDNANGEKPTIDWVGVSTLTVGLILFVFAISSGSSGSSGSDWATPRVLVPLVLSILLFIAFFFIERVVSQPAVPPRTWSNKNFTPLFFYAWSIYWWVFGAEIEFVQVFTDLWGMSALEAALRCLPLGISAGISAYLTGIFAPRVPKKILLVSGQVLMLIGAVLFAIADERRKYWSHLVPGMIIGMIGLASAYVGCTISMMEGARKGEEGVVGAMMYTSYQVGATIGVAVIASITLGVNAQTISEAPSVLFKGYQASYWSLVGLNGIMIILAALFVRN